VQPLEDAEQLLVVLHVESGAVVLHEVDGRRCRRRLFLATDLDDGGSESRVNLIALLKRFVSACLKSAGSTSACRAGR
jgi:hypothetical protein